MDYSAVDEDMSSWVVVNRSLGLYLGDTNPVPRLSQATRFRYCTDAERAAWDTGSDWTPASVAEEMAR